MTAVEMKITGGSEVYLGESTELADAFLDAEWEKVK